MHMPATRLSSAADNGCHHHREKILFGCVWPCKQPNLLLGVNPCNAGWWCNWHCQRNNQHKKTTASNLIGGFWNVLLLTSNLIVLPILAEQYIESTSHTQQSSIEIGMYVTIVCKKRVGSARI